jgi:hypothetical protein
VTRCILSAPIQVRIWPFSEVPYCPICVRDAHHSGSQVDRPELSVHALELGRSRSQDALHHRGTYAQCPADHYETHILLPEAQDALFQLRPLRLVLSDLAADGPTRC